VAPVLWEGAESRSVYLPPGDWYDYWTGKRYSGDTTIQVPVTIDSIPMFVRDGGFIFRQPVVQNTGQMPGNPLRVLIAPAAESESALYEDDGKSLQYRNGGFMKRKFQLIRKAQSTFVRISDPEGSYRPAKRDLVLEMWMDHQPSAVSEWFGNGDKSQVVWLNQTNLATAPAGWSYADGRLIIKDNDRFEQTEFTIKD
jgi:alpha-glucosidase